jgi:hypothetical protein
LLTTTFDPPAELSREQIVRASEALLQRPNGSILAREDLFRIREAGLDWDIGGVVYEPADPSQVARGADGLPVGLFLLHGGAGDHRGKDPMARLIASKLGYRVFNFTMPGKLNLLDPNRRWPGDTLNPDGSARTPLWNVDHPITPDQYELIEDTHDPEKRAKWGTLFFLRAKEGSDFYNRMASWPIAFERAMLQACARHFPVGEYSVYVHGHSTGGPFVHQLLQRVENCAGLVAAESSPFGVMFAAMLGMQWDFPFNYLTVRTWRHIAKYASVESGENAHWRLPWIMEDVLEAWDRVKDQPQLKAEYFITYAAHGALTEAARVTANRLGLDQAGTDALVQRYLNLTRPLEGPGTRPLPPLLYAIMQGSRDHLLARYQETVLPMLAAVTPPPKARVVLFKAGVHGYEKPEEDLPRGCLPAIVQLWDDAIKGGYYLP